MQDLNDKVTGNSLTAAEWDQVPSEIQNVVEGLGITLSGADLNQLGKGIANYVASNNYYIDAGAVDNYQLSPVGGRQGPTSYFNGMAVNFLPNSMNSIAEPSINVNGIGIKTIVSIRGAFIDIGQITNDAPVSMRFDSGLDKFVLEDYSTMLTFGVRVAAIAREYGLQVSGPGSSLIVDCTNSNPIIRASQGQMQMESVALNDGGVGIKVSEIGTGGSLQKVFETVRDSVNGAIARIAHDGTVRMESTSLGFDMKSSVLSNVLAVVIKGGGLFYGLVQQNDDNNSSTYRNYTFFNNAVGTTVGRIRSNSNSTQFLSSSDYRLKEEFTNMSRKEAFNKSKNLAPGMYKWIDGDGDWMYGYIAHVFQKEIPDGVSGEKDEVDEDNNPIYQSVDPGKAVPVLNAALNHAIDAIESLEARLEILEQTLADAGIHQ